MEGMYVTFLRTAACAAVAAKYLAPRPPKTLGLDRLRGAWRLVAAHHERDVSHRSSRCSCRRGRADLAREFCAKMTQEGNWTITPVDDPLQAVRNIDIVVTSIPPGDDKPVTGEALAPGTLFIPLDLVNSWQDDVLPSADRVAADNPATFPLRCKASGQRHFRRSSRSTESRILSSGKSPRASASIETSSRCAGSPARMSWSAGKSTAAPCGAMSGSNSICKDEVHQREV